MAETETWLRTDEAEDVAASVRHALRCRGVVEEDPQAWKWIALALHAALQGALVGHLVTTASPLGAVTDRNAQEWADYFEAARTDPTLRPPKTKLLDLPGLIKSARKPGSCGNGEDAVVVQITECELQWLRRFHGEVRNQFVHFEPMGWSLEVSGLPAMAALVSRIIGETLEMGWAFRHKDAAWRHALRRDLSALAALDQAERGSPPPQEQQDL